MAGKKSAKELKTERITWYVLVAIFVIARVIPEDTVIPNAFTPFAAGMVLIISGLYQYSKKWRVSFITWIAGTLMLVMAGYNVFNKPELDLSPAVIILVAIVIAMGIFTNET